MARLARIMVPGAWHHVTQRGNNKQDVFFVDDDRRVYLELLREQGARYGFRVEGFCLMTNHVHLIGVPEREGINGDSGAGEKVLDGSSFI